VRRRRKPYTGAKTLRRSLATILVPPLSDSGRLAEAVPGTLQSHWRGVWRRPSGLGLAEAKVFRTEHAFLAASV
jgi:hypothetical protein